MTNEPLVTISTPCYNHKKYLADYFESIISQTYKNIELIIIDDASKDNSQKIIENYLPKLKERFLRVEYIPRKKNVGLVRNCNEGLDLARGKYIIGFASDDIMLPTRVEENVKFLEEHKDYGMVYSDAYIFNDDIDIKKINFDNLKFFSKQQKIYSGNVMNQILVSNFIIAPTACIRKNVFDKVGKYNENYCFEDYDMWLKIAEHYKIGYINKKLSLYRENDNSLSHGKERITKFFYTCKMIKDEHIKTGLYDEKYINLSYYYWAKRCLDSSFKLNRKDLFDKFYKEYLDICTRYNFTIEKRIKIKRFILSNKYLFKVFCFFKKLKDNQVITS